MEGPNNFDEILIVDDNPGDIRLIEETLKDAGWNPTVHSVSDGPDAIEFLQKRSRSQLDAILLDLHLARMDGDEVVQRMGNDVRDIPVIAISGSEKGAALKLEDIEDKVDACLTKPIEPEDLEEAAQSV